MTTKGGRYVQGGGCTTVGVAGLIQSGGFGSFSKNYGLAAAGLLEAEIVTADGAVRIANASLNPDIRLDDRTGAPKGNFYWADNYGEAGQVVHGYKSAWLPASLLNNDQRARLVDALFASSRHWGVSLHFNKGLAGAPAEELAAAKDTASVPSVLLKYCSSISVAILPAHSLQSASLIRFNLRLSSPGQLSSNFLMQ